MRERLTALVLGGANSLAADKHAGLTLFEPDLLIASNHAGKDEPLAVDHWCTMHPELFPLWIRQRAEQNNPPAGKLWHARHRRSPVESEAIESWGGSSGLLCVAVALHLGCTHVVLAGVPMQKTFEHYDRKGPWTEARQYWSAWERSVPRMAGRVRSLSGWTAHLLGVPDRRWIDGRP